MARAYGGMTRFTHIACERADRGMVRRAAINHGAARNGVPARCARPVVIRQTVERLWQVDGAQIVAWPSVVPPELCRPATFAGAGHLREGQNGANVRGCCACDFVLNVL